MRVAAFGVASALAIYGAVGLELQGAFKPPGWLVRLGDWSYALYLSHLLVLSGLVRVWVSTLPDFGPMASLAFLIVSTVLCIAVAGAGFHLLEFPALKATRKLGDRIFEGPHRPRRAPSRAGRLGLRNPDLLRRLWLILGFLPDQYGIAGRTRLVEALDGGMDGGGRETRCVAGFRSLCEAFQHVAEPVEA